MTALPHDEVADLSRLVAELEQRLESSFVVYDQAIAQQVVLAQENARLQNEKARLSAETQQALERQTATSEVLSIISRSAFDLEAVLQTLVSSAARLCNATMANMWLREGDVLQAGASCGMSEQFQEFLRAHPARPERGKFVGRAFLTGELVHIPDVLNDPEYTFIQSPRIGQFRAALGVPMIRDGRVEGVFALTRPNPG